MKTVLKVIVVLMLVVGVFFSAILFLTAGMVDTADAFLDEIGSDDGDDGALRYLAAPFRDRSTLDDVRALLAAHDLQGRADTSWSSRNISFGNGGSIGGRVVRADGSDVPFVMTFVKEDDDWKIYSLGVPGAGVAVAGITVPDAATAERLVTETLMAFNEAIKKKDFTEFYRQRLASTLRAERSVAELNQVFQVFIDKAIDLSSLAAVKPVFTEDLGVTADRRLVAVGYFPSKRINTFFSFRFRSEFGVWRLSAINVNLKPVATPDAGAGAPASGPD